MALTREGALARLSAPPVAALAKETLVAVGGDLRLAREASSTFGRMAIARDPHDESGDALEWLDVSNFLTSTIPEVVALRRPMTRPSRQRPRPDFN